eukprot:2320998-Amphidinium_carterae.2
MKSLLGAQAVNSIERRVALIARLAPTTVESQGALCTQKCRMDISSWAKNPIYTKRLPAGCHPPHCPHLFLQPPSTIRTQHVPATGTGTQDT